MTTLLQFTIVDPSKNERLIAHCKRNLVDWEITIYDTGTVDMRILKIFSAFLVDYQDYF
ncbi:MAG: hypothetical protein K940chlam9_00238 [Chlamydiae bacterium]|nr:hypothetical protein [Chlamydiota bacterium]